MATGMDAFGPAGEFTVAELERIPDDGFARSCGRSAPLRPRTVWLPETTREADPKSERHIGARSAGCPGTRNAV